MPHTHVNVSTHIGAVELPVPIYNASGVCCTTSEELDSVLSSHAGAVVTKTGTMSFRQGNPHPRFSLIPQGSVNSMGLPNMGLPEYVGFAQRNSSNKHVFVSTTGTCWKEFTKALSLLREGNISYPEINLSCPNIVGKPQVGYDMEALERYVREVDSILHAPFGVKLPPYFDPIMHNQVTHILLRSDNFHYVTCVNSLGHCLYVDVESEASVIKPNGGFGGFGGPAILPVALANVNKFYKLLSPHGKQVVGCGGVQSGADVFAHILAGASAVQVGTVLWSEGVGVFQRLNDELVDIMSRKNYVIIEDYCGRLKVIT